MGALRATLVRRQDSMTLSGIGVPTLAMMSTPASCSSQLILTPVASMHILVASANSGPTPSPRINVTSCDIGLHSPCGVVRLFRDRVHEPEARRASPGLLLRCELVS